MRKLHYSPLRTNASLNRDAATRAFKAGLTATEIAAEWPEVFKVDGDGKLAQIYDSEIVDGSGRYETRYRITDTAVQAAITRKGGLK